MHLQKHILSLPRLRGAPIIANSILFPCTFHKQPRTPHHFSTQTPGFLLSNKTIIITGATRGIGLAIATKFWVMNVDEMREGKGDGGLKMVLVGRDMQRLEGVKRVLSESAVASESGEEVDFDGQVRCVAGDVRLSEFWRDNFGGVVRKGPSKVDILINAAGITHTSPLIATTDSLIQKVLDTNLYGTIAGCKAVGKNMLKHREGCIINISSLLGLKGGRGSVAYAASKAGVLGLTRALAAEMGPVGIRVNAIVPGYIETDMTRGMTDAARKEALDAIPLKRFGDVDEIAEAAVFLAANKYANNCVINLDGGLSAV